MKQSEFTRADLLGDIRLSVKEGLSVKGINLCADVSGLPKYLHGDRVRLAQAVADCVGLAADSALQGGITLQGRTLVDNDNAYFVQFEVSETATGGASETRASIIDSFAPADAPTSRPGSDEDLAIVRHAARAMGGYVGRSPTDLPGHVRTLWMTAWVGKGKQSAHALAGLKGLVADLA